MAALEAQKLSSTEQTEVQQWITTSERLKSSPQDASILDKLNTHLTSRSTLLGTKPSKADVAIYESLAPAVKAGPPSSAPASRAARTSDADKIKVDPEEILYVKPPTDAKAEKERLKKEKAAAAAAAAGGSAEATVVDRTKAVAQAVVDKAVEVKDAVAAAASGGGGEAKPKKEKKEKAPKPPEGTRRDHAAVASPDRSAGGPHPQGDQAPRSRQSVCRTVCSGLNGLVPLEEMQGRKVVVVANLKPVKMRGIKSCAMVLAASPRLKEGEADDHKGPVELVTPPADAKAGERVCFDGWRGEPEGVLNPKKKIWETFQPGFTTTDDLEVAFDGSVVVEAAGKPDTGKLTTASGGTCTVKTLKGATVR
ncbi:hypothetical protein CIB48_g5445 [Xylaria polymorpha]|nr:hypothetical protein CIB48_g5445 [Xylaria polymorpha]